MKVLMFVESFGGGVYSVVRDISNGLSEKGVEVSIVYSLRKELDKEWRKEFSEKIKLYEFKGGREVSFKNDFLSLMEIVKIFKKINPDIIHCHSSKAGGLGRLLSPFMHGTIFCYSPHGFSFLRKDISIIKRSLYYMMEFLLAKTFSYNILCGRTEYFLSLKRLGKKESYCIENGTDTNFLENSVLDHNANKPKKVITLSRACFQKNPLQYIEISKDTSFQDKISFVWVGGGEQKYIKKMLASGISCFDWMNTQEAIDELKKAHVYLQCSLWEGLPVSVIQAQCLGLPVVAFSTIGNKDIVEHGVTGYLYDTTEEAVAYINKIFDENFSIDEEKKAQIKKRFSKERMVVEYYDFYRGIMKK